MNSSLTQFYNRPFHLFLQLAFVIMLTLTGCVFNPPPEVGPSKVAVQIFVRDDSTQYLLPNAKVRIRIEAVSNAITFPMELTDDNGLAVFHVDTDLLDELAEIEIEMEGYQLNRQQITLRNAMSMNASLVPIGATAVPTPTPTPTPVPTLTLVPTVLLAATITTTPTFTPTPTVQPSATYTSTPTPAPTQTPTSIATPDDDLGLVGTALVSSSIFAEPNSGSAELTFVNPGERVTVLEDQGSWILVRNEAGVEGWSAANRFDITLGTPTPVPVIMAEIIESASIFEAPNAESSDITFLNPGEEVRVLGRSANSAWLFIRTEQNIEGWVATNRLELSVNVETLPVVDVTVTTSTLDEGVISSGDITLDFWNLPGQASCSSGVWTITLFLEAHGGDAPYTYYVDNELVAGAVVGNVTKQFTGADSTSRIYEARVISSSGQEVRKEILVMPPDCD